MKPTILIFSTAYLPLVGGAELAVKEITDRISDFDFLMITARMSRKYPKHERIGNVEVYRLGLGILPFLDKLLLPFLGFFFVVWKLKIKNCKLLWGVMISYASIAAFFVKLFRPKIPFALTIQEGDLEWKPRLRTFGLTSLWWRLIFVKVNYVTAISNYLLEQVRRFGYNGPIDVIPNGVSEKFLEIHMAPNDRYEHAIITSSRLVRKNGIDILLKACAKLRNEFKFKLIIAGDGKERDNLEKLARDLDLETRVKFLGKVPFEKLPEFYASADIFVRPSRSEGLGTSFLESMAAGLITIGTKVGGIPDFLKEGETGLLSKSEDVDDLTSTIRTAFLMTPQKRDEITYNARQLIREKFLWSDIAKNINNVFHKLI